jgi:rRNA-processing protein FCF1
MTSVDTTPSSAPQDLFEETAQVETDPKMFVPRTISKIFKAIEKSEGVGAKVRRAIGVTQLKNFRYGQFILQNYMYTNR